MASAFDERRSLVFKTLRSRFFDKQRNVRSTWLTATESRRQPEEQHRLCSDHELAGTLGTNGRGWVRFARHPDSSRIIALVPE
jgi:hypothetical protein